MIHDANSIDPCDFVDAQVCLPLVVEPGLIADEHST
jgi:hypothetical protein